VTPARFPALILVTGLLAVALVYDARVDEPAPGLTSIAVAPEPAVAATEAARATWFCAGGTVDELASHALVLTNTGSEQRTATVTIVGPSDLEPVDAELVLPAGGSGDLDLAAAVLAVAPGATGPISAVVEVDGGGVVAEHTVTGLGADRAPCASSAGSRWYVPYGSTVRPGARELLVFFNPFVSDAVVDLSFATDNGVRETEEGEGLVVPGRSSVLFDITDSVTVSEVVATTVTARTGQVVVDRIQQFDGTGDDALRGLTVGGAHPETARVWYLPGVRIEGARTERLVVQNPGTERAEVDIELLPHDPDVLLEPFALSVRPGQYATIDLDTVVSLQDDSITDVNAVVRSANGVPVVVNRVVAVPQTPPDVVATEAAVPGVSATVGMTAPARRLVVGADLVPGGAGSRLTIVNPSADAIAVVTLTVLEGGARDALEPVELAPGATLVVDLDELADGPMSVLVDSTAPLVAARETVGITSRSVASAVPFVDS